MLVSRPLTIPKILAGEARGRKKVRIAVKWDRLSDRTGRRIGGGPQTQGQRVRASEVRLQRVRILKSTVGGSMNLCAAIGYLIWSSHICAVVSTASLDAAA
jgi:hypothetical protein